MEIISNSSLLISFLSLLALEIVLGIDNVVFIALVCGNSPDELRERARVLGLTLALIMRIFMLFSVAWIIGLNEPLVKLFGHGLSGKGILLLLGGIFLVYKATDSIHHEVTGEKEAELKQFCGGFTKVIMQVVLIDLVFIYLKNIFISAWLSLYLLNS